MKRIIKFVCLFLVIAMVIFPVKRIVTRNSDGFDPGVINIMKK